MIKPKLILPKTRVTVPKGVHLYFLGGAIQGAGDWHKDAIDMLTAEDPGCNIVCPSRYITDNHEYAKYALPDENNIPEYPSQTLWERYYLELAAEEGCNLFWLPVEDKYKPRKPEKGPYGRDTYGELGEWRMRIKFNIGAGLQVGKPVHFVLGGEEKFHGLDVITKNFKKALGENYIIHPTLKETVDAAINEARIAHSPLIINLLEHSHAGQLVYEQTGKTIKSLINKAISERRKVVLDFTEIKTLASIFATHCFGDLYETHSHKEIVGHIKLINIPQKLIEQDILISMKEGQASHTFIDGLSKLMEDVI